jgi:4'-phosphopantetheinyl transferase
VNPSPATQLDERTVHVWSVRLQGSDADLAVFSGFLSSDERERAARFAFAHLARSFVFGRGALRMLLSSYAGIPPGDVSFQYGPNGKPALASPRRLRFNASHSADHALFAFVLDYEIGVDIEEIRSIPELLQISSQFFCPAEEADLRSVAPEQQALAFSLCWTRKEAYIKAKGGGLSIPLDSFRVSLLPGEEASFLQLPKVDGGTPWTLQSLKVPAGFAGAVAYPSRPRQLRMFPAMDAAALLPNRLAQM